MTDAQFTPYSGGTLTASITVASGETKGRVLITPASAVASVGLLIELTPSSDSSYSYPVPWSGLTSGFLVAVGDVVTVTAHRYPSSAADAPRIHIESYS